jgi:hypothetical protein
LFPLFLGLGAAEVEGGEAVGVGEVARAGQRVAEVGDDGGAGTPGFFGSQDDPPCPPLCGVVGGEGGAVVGEAFADQVHRARGAGEDGGEGVEVGGFVFAKSPPCSFV